MFASPELERMAEEIGLEGIDDGIRNIVGRDWISGGIDREREDHEKRRSVNLLRDICKCKCQTGCF